MTSSSDEARECFTLFDTDHTGTVPAAQVGHMLRAMGQFYSWSDIRALTKELGGNDSRIGFDKFIEVMERRYAEVPDGFVLKETFRTLDKMRVQKIDLRFLKHALTTLGDKLTPRQFEICCAANGINTTKIDFDQFIDLCLGVDRSTRVPTKLFRLSAS